jgi:hypothetical protein
MLATQETEIRKIKARLGKKFTRPYLEKTHHKNELVE